jgi:HEAT repeat protein
MIRTLAAWAVLLFISLPAAHAEEDEPVVLSKPLSQWLEMLRNDGKPERRRAALIALEQIGAKRSRQVVPAIMTALRADQDEKVRERAAAVLGTSAEKALKDIPEGFKFDPLREVLVGALKEDKSARVREAAARALGRLEVHARQAVGALAGALKDPSPATRAAAADTLRRLGPDSHEALPELEKVLRDKSADRATRVQCALAVGRVGIPDALDSMPALKDVLADTTAPSDVRKAVCESLALLGKEAASAAPVLGQTLTASTSDVALRRAAALAIDALGPDGRIAIPSLKKALKDDDKFVRCHAMHSLGQFGKELGAHSRDVVTGLLVGMDDNVLEVRVTAIETLGILGAEGLGPDAPAVAERLEIAARDVQKPVSEAAAVALKKVRGMPN